MTGLSISLLGRMTVSADRSERTVEVAGAQARLALAMLTLERHVGVRTESLADALWPEGRPATWTSALRNVVSRLRHQLDGVLDAGAVDAVLVAHDGSYRLQLPAGSSIDVEMAEQEIVVARRALEEGDLAVARASAAASVRRLRGRFLDGQDNAWVEAQRPHLAALLTTGLETQAEAALASGDAKLAAGAAQEAIEREPLREAAHRLLMAAHTALGNRAEALRAYQRLRRFLIDELGVDPDAETEAAYVRLLGPASDAAPALAGDRTHPEPRVLVGRDEEMAAAVAAWERAAAGSRTVLLVTGEPGIGKSRLLAEVARRVVAQGALVLFGRCDADGLVPYRPFIELLDALVAAATDGSFPDLTLAARAELAEIFPSFSRWRAQPTRRPDRALLFHAVARLLAHAARDRPLVMVIDDLDAMDGDSVLLMRHLLRPTSGGGAVDVIGAHVMVVLASRAEQPSDHLVAGAISGLERDGELIRLPLGGLDPLACRELVEAVLPGEPMPHALAEHLVAETAGNPFMIVELLRSRLVDQAEWAIGAVPQTGRGLEALVVARLAGLSDAAVALLRIAAVCGSPFEQDIASKAAGLPPAEAATAVDEAVAAGLLAETRTDPAVGVAGASGHLRFVHEIVRQTLYRQLGPDRRREFHERVADAVERLRADRLGPYRTAVAHHRIAGTRASGDERAMRAVVAAATAARRRGAPTEALRWCREALGHVGPGEDEHHAEVLVELGATQAELDDDDAGVSLFGAAMRARQVGRIDLVARAALDLADLAGRRPRHRPDALALAGEIVAAGPPPEVDAEVLWARVVARWVQLGGGATRPGPLADAVAAARILGRQLAGCRGLERVAERVELAEDLQAIAAASGSAGTAATAAHHQAMARALVGDWDAVDHALAMQPGPSGDRNRADRAATHAVITGRFDALPAQPPPPPGLVAHQRVVARWLLGDLAPADVEILAEAAADVDGAIALRAGAGLLLCLAGEQLGQARIALHELVGGLRSSLATDAALHLLGLLSLAAVELADQAIAHELGRILRPHARLTCGIGYRTFAGTSAFHLGRLAAVTGDWAEAEQQLSIALRQLMPLRALPWIALTQETLARVLESRGRSSDRALIAALHAESTWLSDHLQLRRRAIRTTSAT